MVARLRSGTGCAVRKPMLREIVWRFIKPVALNEKEIDAQGNVAAMRQDWRRYGLRDERGSSCAFAFDDSNVGTV